ncbi:hypothetical protein RHSIM_Rhsim08G0090200 [Rhododendron simsii]|uniref:RRM domain-containing protein n=1 Tax=Rhododendron simsii TaxID=118357 RepID=A0A834LDG2_RHOSS|nr:hypothetical protein RHSIM_Rhsim08G0090200 [Rhododendron simsii]
MDERKLFIGGIEQETSEATLREYFGNYGGVKEIEIPRDRITGYGRGFGFVTFDEPSVANEVINGVHTILGRKVEVKHAQPKGERYENQQMKPLSAKKIFVGGLPPNITQAEFKNFFERFGATTDVVVMCDKETNKPRGFGFITFDSKEAVDNVLQRRFYELNDKYVEVKRAKPKDMNSRHICMNKCNNTALGCEISSGSFGRHFPYGANSPYGGGFPNLSPIVYQYLVFYPPYMNAYMNGWDNEQMGATYGNGTYEGRVMHTVNGGDYANGWPSGPVEASGVVNSSDGGGNGQGSEMAANNVSSNEKESGGDTELPTSMILVPIQPQADDALCSPSSNAEHQMEAPNCQPTPCESS